MRKALLLAAALAALALPGAAGAYSLPAADISVRVAPDGSLLIAEHITIEGAFHGAYRDIPLRKGESIDRIQLSEQGEKYTRGGSTKLGSIDTPHTFNYELHKNKVRIVWHFSAGGEPHTYTVAYRFRGLAVAYSDIVDVNLKVWGANWSAPVSDLRATMALPRPTTLGPLYNVWGHPAWVKGVVERTKPGRPAPRGQRLRGPVRRDARHLPSLAAALDRRREGRPRARTGEGEEGGGGRPGRLPPRPGEDRRRQAPPRADAGLPRAARNRTGARLDDPRLGALRPRARHRLRPRVRAGARRPTPSRPWCRRCCARTRPPARRSSRRPSST